MTTLIERTLKSLHLRSVSGLGYVGKAILTTRGIFTLIGIIVAVAIVIVSAPWGLVKSPAAGKAPFTWQGSMWCPTYRASAGCDNVQQKGILSSAGFYPSQVLTTSDSSYVVLKMNSDASKTGAFNTQTYETWNPPASISERIRLPCNAAGKIENWPAFWLVSTGSWPASDEIDVVEGLNGLAAWHYHYLNSSGKQRSAGRVVPGFSGCGTHTYAVNWTKAAITFYYDGADVGRITPAEIGVAIASGPMYVINDYAASSTYGGPTTGNVDMEVLNFSR